MAGSEAAGHQRVVKLVADAHRQVDALFHQVYRALQCDQLDLRLRVLLEEVRHGGGQMRLRK